MSVVAINGVPSFWNLKRLVSTVAKVVKGKFDALNFHNVKGSVKTAYIRVSEKLDPQRVVESINRLSLNNCKLNAFIPDRVPDMPLASMSKSNKKKGKGRVRQTMNVTPEQILATVHSELLVELQSKYTGLYDLSQKTSHQLLDEIAETIFKRLKHIMETNPESHDNCFKLSSFYRKAHPHFGDFEQILMTLHRIQDATGVQRTQVSEQELSAFNSKPTFVDRIPWPHLQKWNIKYAERIAKQIKDHIERLDSTAAAGDAPEDVARKRVRAELKRLAPYMMAIVTEVATQHVTPDQSPVYKIRIYGEPYLPNRQVLDPILRKLQASYATRSSHIFNMVRFNVHTNTFPATVSLNGVELGGAKLVVRLSMPPKYKTRLELRQAMATALNPHNQLDPMDLVDMEEEIDFEGGESWDE